MQNIKIYAKHNWYYVLIEVARDITIQQLKNKIAMKFKEKRYKSTFDQIEAEQGIPRTIDTKFNAIVDKIVDHRNLALNLKRGTTHYKDIANNKVLSEFLQFENETDLEFEINIDVSLEKLAEISDEDEARKEKIMYSALIAQGMRDKNSILSSLPLALNTQVLSFAVKQAPKISFQSHFFDSGKALEDAERKHQAFHKFLNSLYKLYQAFKENLSEPQETICRYLRHILILIKESCYFNNKQAQNNMYPPIMYEIVDRHLEKGMLSLTPKVLPQSMEIIIKQLENNSLDAFRHLMINEANTLPSAKPNLA